MQELYKYYNGKKLRCGYTTGSCAAAASKASVAMLLSGKRVDYAKIITPKKSELTLEITDCEITPEYASCAVKKDSGDDPDVTNGMLIYARAEKISSGIVIEGGIGIGRITKDGLDQPVGAAAINSVPRQMIASSVHEIMEKHNYWYGIRITIYAPDGERIARKTYNPRIGIIGGISIIGTTGIVEPMSSAALIETIRMEERMKKTGGYDNLLLTLGNYSESFISEVMPDILGRSVKCSNYIGEAVDAAIEYGFKSVLIIGHAGKLVKLGAGIMNTHSSQADGRMEVLMACGVIAGAELSILKKLADCVTVDDAFGILKSAGVFEKTISVLMEKIQYHLEIKAHGSIKIAALVFSNKYGIIGKTEHADKLINLITEEYNG